MTERINVSLRTDQGLVRDHNEDFVTSWEPKTTAEAEKHGWLYIVADGVGGADAGEVASQFASERVIAHYLANSETKSWGERLIRAMHSANTDLRQLVIERDANTRMATTMVAAVVQNGQAFIGNVGDSRGYHWRNGNFRQITKDQSLVAKLLEEGAITEEEAEDHPHKNVILYSIGSEASPKIDLFHIQLEPNDIVLLCSDGLSGYVTDSEIEAIISREVPETATKQLIALANQRGGPDNISVGLLQITDEETQEVEVAHSATEPVAQTSQTSLLLYTIFLSLVQTALIVMVWLWLTIL
ncbi:MAG: Stp1/IreP family PP2C-type Ser/Thr phosphatase [Chloroflexota bacterium]